MQERIVSWKGFSVCTFPGERQVLLCHLFRISHDLLIYNLESCNAFYDTKGKGWRRKREGPLWRHPKYVPPRSQNVLPCMSPSSRSPKSKPFVLHCHFLFLYTKLGYKTYNLERLLGFDCYIRSKLPFVS